MEITTSTDTVEKPPTSAYAGLVPVPVQAPDVSIVVPCYNTAKFLDQCLESIAANDSASIEVIVVNDGSKDDSLAIMRRFEQRDPRFHVIDKPNGGYGMGVNVGLLNAHGTYFAIVEPDDYLQPHFYDEMMAYARTFAELPDVVKTPYTRVFMPGTPKERLYRCAYYDRIKSPQPFTIADETLLIQCHPSIWSAMYRKEFLDQKGIRMMEVPGAGWVDNPFLIETMVQASSIVYLEKEFYCYREDLPGSSSMLRATTLAFTRWHNMMDILEKLGVDDPGILTAHYIRGFSYLAGIMAETKITGTDAEDLMHKTFDRMDPKLVVATKYLDNGRKEMFLRARGLDVKDFSWDRGAHFRELVSTFFYSWRTNGFGFAMTRVGLFFARKLNLAVGDPTKTRSAGI